MSHTTHARAHKHRAEGGQIINKCSSKLNFYFFTFVLLLRKTQSGICTYTPTRWGWADPNTFFLCKLRRTSLKKQNKKTLFKLYKQVERRLLPLSCVSENGDYLLSRSCYSANSGQHECSNNTKFLWKMNSNQNQITEPTTAVGKFCHSVSHINISTSLGLSWCLGGSVENISQTKFKQSVAAVFNYCFQLLWVWWGRGTVLDCDMWTFRQWKVIIVTFLQ